MKGEISQHALLLTTIKTKIWWKVSHQLLIVLGCKKDISYIKPLRLVLLCGLTRVDITSS